MTRKQLMRIARLLKGKTIASVDMHPFPLGWEQGVVGADPVFRFTDGSTLQFAMVDAVEDQNGESRQGVTPLLKLAEPALELDPELDT